MLVLSAEIYLEEQFHGEMPGQEDPRSGGSIEMESADGHPVGTGAGLWHGGEPGRSDSVRCLVRCPGKALIGGDDDRLVALRSCDHHRSSEHHRLPWDA